MDAPGPRWPLRLVALCRKLAPMSPGMRAADAEGRSEAWVLLRDALLRFLRHHASQAKEVTQEDLEDLASAKALDLVSRAELGTWALDGRTVGEVGAYLSAVA